MLKQPLTMLQHMRLHAIISSPHATLNYDFKPFTKIQYRCIDHEHNKLGSMSQTVKTYLVLFNVQYRFGSKLLSIAMDYNQVSRQRSCI